MTTFLGVIRLSVNIFPNFNTISTIHFFLLSPSSINTNYKRTTDQQYRLLTRELAKGTSQGKHFWLNLTESLNNLGPPYRNMSQWKKVNNNFSNLLSLLIKFANFLGLDRFSTFPQQT